MTYFGPWWIVTLGPIFREEEHVHFLSTPSHWIGVMAGFGNLTFRERTENGDETAS